MGELLSRAVRELINNDGAEMPGMTQHQYVSYVMRTCNSSVHQLVRDNSRAIGYMTDCLIEIAIIFFEMYQRDDFTVGESDLQFFAKRTGFKISDEALIWVSETYASSQADIDFCKSLIETYSS